MMFHRELQKKENWRSSKVFLKFERETTKSLTRKASTPIILFYLSFFHSLISFSLLTAEACKVITTMESSINGSLINPNGSRWANLTGSSLDECRDESMSSNLSKHSCRGQRGEWEEGRCHATVVYSVFGAAPGAETISQEDVTFLGPWADLTSLLEIFVRRNHDIVFWSRCWFAFYFTIR